MTRWRLGEQEEAVGTAEERRVVVCEARGLGGGKKG